MEEEKEQKEQLTVLRAEAHGLRRDDHSKLIDHSSLIIDPV